MLTKCYICNTKTHREKGKNIFNAKTIKSCTFAYKLLENFLGHEILYDTTNCMTCENCFFKLNEYDMAFCTAQRIQNELSQLLHKTENKRVEKNESEENINLGMINLEEDGVTFIIEEADKKKYLIEDNHEIFIEQEGVKEEDLSDEAEYITSNLEDKVLSPTEKTNTQSPVKKKRQREKFCKLCERYFPNNKALNEHRKEEHNIEERFVCDICGISYKVRSALKVHIGMHNGESPFKCEVCGKSFTQKGALQRHSPIHTGEFKYQCDKCGKQFIHYSSFHMHNLAHNDVRSKKCEVCGFLLRSSSHLNRHMLVHTGLKPHACPKCGQRFAQKYNMMSHLRSHHQGIHRKSKREYTYVPHTTQSC